TSNSLWPKPMPGRQGLTVDQQIHPIGKQHRSCPSLQPCCTWAKCCRGESKTEEDLQGLNDDPMTDLGFPASQQCLQSIAIILDRDGDGQIDITELMGGIRSYKRKMHRVQEMEKKVPYEETLIGRVNIKLERALEQQRKRQAGSEGASPAGSRRGRHGQERQARQCYSINSRVRDKRPTGSTRQSARPPLEASISMQAERAANRDHVTIRDADSICRSFFITVNFRIVIRLPESMTVKPGMMAEDCGGRRGQGGNPTRDLGSSRQLDGAGADGLELMMMAWS
uniref:EF-hand domain-containing protein n=1 Tax=Macrostomum lignano TaxID=282301 RepID=A0A1I8FCT4_9PLAT